MSESWINRPGAGTKALPKVLLVDDDEVTLMMTATALQVEFDVVECNGGDAALRLMRGWKPDLVVLDALMPNFDGFDVCRALREELGYEDVPVLMLSGLDDEFSVARAFECGATDFVVKTHHWSLLRQRLHSLLRMAATHRELVRSKANLARAQDLARMGSFEWWRNDDLPFGRGLVLSEEALRVMGHWPDEPFSIYELMRRFTPEVRHDFIGSLRTVLRHSSVLAEDVPVTLPDGRERVLHFEAEPEFSDYGEVQDYRGIVQDVTDRRRAEDSIRRLASTDPLTTLPNRRQLMHRAQRAIDTARVRGHMVALLMIDLDRFKNINDTLGHIAGDELLIEVAARLRTCVRHHDDMPEYGLLESAGNRSVHRQLEAMARLGGDEFVALLPEVSDEADAQRVAQRILEALRQPLAVMGREFVATASVGIAVYPRDGNDVDELMRSADVAMYAAKGAGRNASVVYSPMLAVNGTQRLELEAALHKAEERGELRLYYQPKVDAVSNRVVGVEALMRWQRPDRLVFPDEFIALAEETGLIVPMSMWVLKEAARQSRRWFDEFGYTEPIAVNMPSRMFLRTDLVDLVLDATRSQGLPPERLQLELTEGTLMNDAEGIIGRLGQLNELGVQLSIDDFGTGYSSLSYLTRLPISELKIDKSFVKGLGAAAKSTVVITTIVALARALGLKVIAEGVENLTQHSILHRQGCSMMQGYLFSKPLDAEAMGKWIVKFHAGATARPMPSDDLDDWSGLPFAATD